MATVANIFFQNPPPYTSSFETMPYAMPSPPSPEVLSHELPPIKLKSKHRRTRSSTPTFSTERGQGTFVPMAGIPRRKSSKAQFHFDDHDSDSSDETAPAPPPPVNGLGLSVDTKNVPSNAPSMYLHVQSPNSQTSSLPFPQKGSPTNSPRPPSPPHSGVLQRTPSTPIILSNGKPLKPSLKSSQSSPHVPGLRMHSRVQSEPTTPGGTIVKNVHFAEKDALQSVRLFNKSGKPASVSKALADETETETEYDSSNPNNDKKTIPFPTVSNNLSFEVNTQKSSVVPLENPPRYANVHLETLNLPSSRPPMLCGSVLVRNLAYSKEVAVRFTLDEWQTTSEVSCKHVVSLPSLPPPFNAPSTYGDHAAASLTANAWDRFNFTIRLEDFERKLSEKTIHLVVRFTSPGTGEWWDNNSGRNYHVCFKPAADPKDGASSSTATDPARFSPVMGNSQQRTFSAPPTLKGTPTTEAVQAVAKAQPPSTTKLTLQTSFAIGAGRRHSSSSPRSPTPSRSNSSPSISSSPSSNNFPTSAAYMRASLPTKLNLLNYAAPSQSPSAASTPTGNSPNATYRNFPHSNPLSHMGLIGGMPATDTPQYDYSWPPSNNSSSQSLAPPPSPPPSYSFLSPNTPEPAPSNPEKQVANGNSQPLSSDSSYAALISQWCFAQSPTPSPGVHMSTESRDVRETPSHGRQRPGGLNDWRGLDTFNGLYGVRSDSPMLAS